VFLYIGTIILLILKSTESDVIEEGFKIPELIYRNSKGSHVLIPNDKQNTLIFLFHLKCDPCSFLLQQLNNQLHKFIETELLLLTVEDIILKNEEKNPWDNLLHAKNVQWGVVKKHHFKRLFGSTTTPYILIFGKQGELRCKFLGLTTIETILASFDVPGHHNSGKTDALEPQSNNYSSNIRR